MSVTDRGATATVSTGRSAVRESVAQSVLLALKVMIIAFNKQLNGHWPKIARIVRDLSLKKGGGGQQYLWNFIDFVMATNTSLTPLIAPLVQWKMSHAQTAKQPPAGGEAIPADAHSPTPGATATLDATRLAGRSKCYATLIAELNRELHAMKEDFTHRSIHDQSRTPTIGDLHSDSGSTHSHQPGGGAPTGAHRLSAASASKRPDTAAAQQQRLSISQGKGVGKAGSQRVGETHVHIEDDPKSSTAVCKSAEPPVGTAEEETSDAALSRHRSTIRTGKGGVKGRWRSRFGSSAAESSDVKPQTLAEGGPNAESFELQHMPAHQPVVARTKSLMRRKPTVRQHSGSTEESSDVLTASQTSLEQKKCECTVLYVIWQTSHSRRRPARRRCRCSTSRVSTRAPSRPTTRCRRRR